MIPVRAMRSKRTTSVSSSIQDEHDEVDGDDSDSDEEEKTPANETPISYEYVAGPASPVIHYKLPKHSEEVAKAVTTKFLGNSKSALAKKQLTVGQTSMVDAGKVEVFEEESVVAESQKKPMARFSDTIQRVLYNRSRLSVQEESILWLVVFILVAFAFSFILRMLWVG